MAPRTVSRRVGCDGLDRQGKFGRTIAPAHPSARHLVVWTDRCPKLHRVARPPRGRSRAPRYRRLGRLNPNPCDLRLASPDRPEGQRGHIASRSSHLAMVDGRSPLRYAQTPNRAMGKPVLVASLRAVSDSSAIPAGTVCEPRDWRGSGRLSGSRRGRSSPWSAACRRSV
jgi:hypothetical protein